MGDNNIYVKIQAEDNLSDVQIQLREVTNQAKSLERQMRELDRAEQEDAATIKSMVKDEEKLQKKLKDNAAYYQQERKAIQDSINVSQQNIAVLKKQVKSMQAMEGSGQRMVMQLRAMREQLQEMEDAGLGSSQAFIDLSIKAGKLADQIGDTQQRISILASDTKELDAAMGAGAGLTGVFSTATSTVGLFGGEMEGLQSVFYKVQSAMSVLYGIQQVANSLNKDSAAMVVLNNAVEKIRAKQKLKTAAAEATETAATVANTTATGAQIAVTEGATAAQWSLNAAMLANPIGIIIAIVLAAIAILASFTVGVLKLVRAFSDAGKAEKEYNKANKEYMKQHEENAEKEAKIAHDRQKQQEDLTQAETKALAAAKKRNASEMEMAQIKLAFAKRANDEASKFADDEQSRLADEVEFARQAMEAKQRQVDAERDGSKKQKKAREELEEASNNYYEALGKLEDAEKQRTETANEVANAEQELEDKRTQLKEQADQLSIELMRDGAAKEIRQINASYKEQLEQVKGNTDEEIAVRKKLEAKKAREIREVRRKYALQAQQEAIQEQKNYLTAMSQSRGTEADYAQEIALTKAVAEQEAQARLAALDKEKMSDEAYANEVEAIQLELAANIKQIDDQEAERKAKLALTMADNQVKAAQLATERLRGNEGAAGQLKVWGEYYDARKGQIEQQANEDIAAVQRSTQTEEEKAAAIKAIMAQMNSDLIALTKERAQTEVDINSQSIGQLERNLADIEAKISQNNNPFTKADGLQERLDAQMALYDAQASQVQSLYDNELISFQDYQQQMYDIEKNRVDAAYQYNMDKTAALAEGFETAIGYLQNISSMAFDALQIQVQAELDALDENYTTDAEEAKKNSNKKLITEKEYEQKKAALEEKAAKYRKMQTLTDIGIQTALSIITTLAQPGMGGTPWGIAAAAIAAAMGAAQLAIAAAKPLAQYEKGRKGGRGEYAIVGERGAELMYIPQGASIVPHNKLNTPEAWGDYGVPSIALPEIPNVSDSTITSINNSRLANAAIDYDRLGAAVAANIPEYKAVSVHVDRSGITVSDGRDTHRYLNRKYAGLWN